MLELNVDQKRNFVTTLGHVDNLLSDCERVLEISRTPLLLLEYVGDISPERQERVRGYIAHFRDEAGRLLNDHGLMPTLAHKSALDTVLTNLLFVDMALAEIDSKNMDHGALSDETARELDGIVMQMRRLIQDMRTSLNSGQK